nr:MAG TPA: hypothetical protein [Caudoviricetes sp.]
MNQANSIMSRSRGNSSRIDKVRNTSFRYYDNIRKSQGKWNYNDDSSYNKKYPRSTYMGLNNG